MKIAVLGGGNGSYAAAADLSEAGHEVRFWRRDGAALKPVLDTKTIRLRDFKGTRDVKIAKPTADIGEALRGAELIVAPTPAFAQDDLAITLAPHLADGQVIFLPPGTFGSYLMTRVLRANGCRAQVTIAETAPCPGLPASTDRQRLPSPRGRPGCRPARFRQNAPTPRSKSSRRRFPTRSNLSRMRCPAR